MNKVYIYDNTFYSLISLINYLVKNNIKVDNIKNNTYMPSLFEEIININIPLNNKEINYFKTKYSYIFKVMYYLFLSEDINKELIIYYLYLNTLKYKNNTLNMRNLKCVNASLKISSYVSREAHKLKGFIRFSKLNNEVLYAKINPTSNVIELLSNHFKKRLKNEYWIIHDTKRDLLSIYTQKDYYIIDAKKVKLNLEKDYDIYEDLWCTFYDTIGIKERKNSKCRMNFMPKKYWENIIEMRNIK